MPKAILGFFPWSLESCSFWRLLRLAASLAILRRFSSSEPDASLSDMYSATTCQPSLLLSATYQLLPLLNTLPASWESFLICNKFGSMLSLSVSILSKKVFNSALSSNYFWFPVNFSCTTSLCNLLLCSICFPLSSNFFLKKIFKHGKDLINGC